MRGGHDRATRRSRPICALAFAGALTISVSANAADDGWRSLRDLPTDALYAHVDNNPVDSRLALRARLTLADRLATRDRSNARAWVDSVLRHSDPESDEQAFAQAIDCQLVLRSGATGTQAACASVRDRERSVSSALVRAQIAYIGSLLAYREGEHAASLAGLERVLSSAERAGDPRLCAFANNLLGVHQATARRPRLALPHFEEAWDFAMKAVDSADIQNAVRLNVANMYSQIGRHEEALEVFAYMRDHPEFRQPVRKLIVKTMHAEAQIGTGQPALAAAELEEVMAETQDNVRPDTYAYALSTLAHAQLDAGNLSTALDNFSESMRVIDVFPPDGLDKPRVQPVLVPYARALAMAGRNDEASVVLDSIIANTPADEPNQILLNAWLERSRNAQANERYDVALAAARQANEIQEQLTNSAYEYQIGRLHASIELDNRTAELELANERAEQERWVAQRESRLRNLSLLVAVLILLVGYLWLGRHMQKRLATRERSQNQVLERRVAQRTEELENEMASRLAGELEKSQLTQQLAESEKMRALGQLTAGVAHDFNNLMTVVTLTSDYLQQKHFPRESEPHQLLDDILAAADSGARITNGLLAYARRQTLVPEQIELAQFFRDNDTLFRNSLGERVALVVNVDACSINIDSGQLTTAILNLLLNAREAMPDGGVVDIDSKVTAEFAEVCVRDTGTGMPADTLEKAVEPFFTTKASSEGAGLGLSMVFGFAEQSGGALELTSEPGNGTVARLRLPIAARPLAVVAPDPKLTLHADSPRRVLVAEDRDALRAMLGQLLEALGWDVTAVGCAESALREVAKNGLPDLLITDVLMPGSMDGHALADRLRRQDEALPVLVMSGYADAAVSDYAFLAKPFTQRDLRVAIDAALERSACQDDGVQAASR